MSNENNFKNKYFRNLPSVGRIIENTELQAYPRPLALEAIKDVLNSYKKKIISTQSEDEIKNLDFSFENISHEVLALAIGYSQMSIRQGINATGDILADHLGRAPLGKSAIQALQNTARYTNLAGSKDRDFHLQRLLSILTGAESGLIVNNNTAGIMLILNTFAQDKEVIISRGELIESDGYRLPDIISKSRAKMVSVGATNKTHLKDYINAINENTAVLLKTRKSNYRIAGFAEEVPIQDLVELGKKHNIIVIDNLESGFIIDMAVYGFPDESSAFISIKKGASIVCLSGDKFFGGPQGGIILGKKEYISLMKKNILYRAFRPSKLVISAMEANLRLYLEPDRILKEIPILQFLFRSKQEIDSMTYSLKEKINCIDNIDIFDGYSKINSISIDSGRFPTKLISIKPVGISASSLAEKLSSRRVPVFVNIDGDKIVIDLRAVQIGELDHIATALLENLRHE